MLHNFLFANSRIKFTCSLSIVNLHPGPTDCPHRRATSYKLSFIDGMCMCHRRTAVALRKTRRTRSLGSNSVSNERTMSLRCCWKPLLTFTIQLRLPEIFIALNALEVCVIQHVVFVTRAFPCQEITLLTVSLRIRPRYALTR